MQETLGRIGLPVKQDSNDDTLVVVKISEPEYAYTDARRHGESLVVFVDDTRPFNDRQNLNDRGHEPWKAWKKQVGPVLLKHFGLEGTDAKVTYSSKAGCAMCPCSPGLVIRNAGWKLGRKMVTATVVAPEVTATT